MNEAPGQNPYASPSPEVAELTLVPQRRASLARGLAASLLFAPIGIAIPYALLVGIFLLRLTIGYHPADYVADLNRIGSDGVSAACGVGLLFAMAAFVNYTPARPIGLVHALILVGGGMIGAAFVTAIAGSMLGFGRQTYHDESRAEAFTTVVGIFISLLCTVALTRHLVLREN